LLHPIADLERPDTVGKSLDCPPVFVADRDRERTGQTPLPGGAKGGPHDVCNGLVEDSVRHDDDAILRPALRLNPLSLLRCAAIDVPSNRGRSDERDPFDFRIIQNRVDDVLGAVDEIEHTRWKAALMNQLKNKTLGEWNLLRRLDNKRVAARHRVGKKPERHHRWKIERGNRGKNAEGLADYLFIDSTRGPVFEAITHQQ